MLVGIVVIVSRLDIVDIISRLGIFLAISRLDNQITLAPASPSSILGNAPSAAYPRRLPAKAFCRAGSSPETSLFTLAGCSNPDVGNVVEEFKLEKSFGPGRWSAGNAPDG
ncbi:hypothetical protein IMZ48_21065 [Candidatus Bathyarchaeota archaeon]|nr:hypothetical protein [Candidatus Bathyarchaeota archaeon]